MGSPGYTIALPAQAPNLKEPNVKITELPPTPPSPNKSIPLRSITLRDPALITTEFDAHRFQAAAYTQLISAAVPKFPTQAPTPTTPPNSTPSDSLITSPYNKPGHYLSLSTPPLPLPSLLLAVALTSLQPTLPTYATAHYTSALNLDVVLDVLCALVKREGLKWPETRFYVVVFRSKLKDNIDNDYLYKLDEESHAEACASGGLLKYWFGKSDLERRNLATCFWHSREDAYRGGLGPWHKKARAAGRELYEHITFTTHWFTVLEGVEGYTFEDHRQ
ncbi:hypothetical protein COCSADRAFT_170940 [Bipolaris sorokiniana ND90Pr]|nr:uncharacterized protein COCSADRAFT_170940 [Bipolaris sorokiniana ND90Pr]EMD65123.1 hypothetical protein COCSADRAFT_170940 [Bipolaris sorokiniana ND90Pr]